MENFILIYTVAAMVVALVAAFVLDKLEDDTE
jgi:hypothetical protein